MNIIRANTRIINNFPRKEIYYQNVLEHVLNGKHKVLPSGITDITTDNFHAEIKKWNKWKQALGQLLAYDTYDPRKELQVYLFNQYSIQNKIIAINTFKKYDIIPFEFIEDEEKDKLFIYNLFTQKCIYNGKL
jgi:hypothetical protein